MKLKAKQLKDYQFPIFVKISWAPEVEYHHEELKETVYQFEHKPYSSDAKDWLIGFLWLLSYEPRGNKETIEYLIKKITGEEIIHDNLEYLNVEVFRKITEEQNLYQEYETENTDNELYWIYNEYKKELEEKGWDKL